MALTSRPKTGASHRGNLLEQLAVRPRMNAIKFLCFALILAGLGCRHLTTPAAQDKELRCNRLVDEITLAMSGYVAALRSVRDLDTANEAAVKIREIAERFDGISEEFSRLSPISKELKFRLLKKMELMVQRERAISFEGVSVLTPEERKIVFPATALFGAKYLATATKAGIYCASSEYEARSAPVKPPSWRRHLPASATDIQEWSWADGFLPDFSYQLKARVTDAEFHQFVASLGLTPHTPERKYSEASHWLSWSPSLRFVGKWWDASNALTSTYVKEGHDTWMFAKHENGFLYFKCFSH